MAGHNVPVRTAPFCPPLIPEHMKHKVKIMWCSPFAWETYGWIPADVEPFVIVFVDSDVVVTQSKHPGQQGYQWTRQTDAGVPRHVVPLIESARAIWKDFEGIMRIQMAPDFISVLSPLFISLYLYFAFLLFHFHRYWFLYLFPAWCCSPVVFLHWQVN